MVNVALRQYEANRQFRAALKARFESDEGLAELADSFAVGVRRRGG